MTQAKSPRRRISLPVIVAAVLVIILGGPLILVVLLYAMQPAGQTESVTVPEMVAAAEQGRYATITIAGDRVTGRLRGDAPDSGVASAHVLTSVGDDAVRRIAEAVEGQPDVELVHQADGNVLFVLLISWGPILLVTAMAAGLMLLIAVVLALLLRPRSRRDTQGPPSA